MKKYLEFCFWTTPDRIDGIRTLLKDEFGLIPPLPRSEVGFISTTGPIPDDTEREKIVFTNERGDGVYRVDFNPTNERGAQVYFRYWQGHNAPEIEGDPMLEAIQRVYEVLKPVECASAAGGWILEEIVDEP